MPENNVEKFDIGKNFVEINVGDNNAGLISIYQNIMYSFMVFVVDEKYSRDSNKDIIFANEYGCSVVILIYKSGENYAMSCASSNRSVRALEFMGYVFENYGIAKGNTQTATGKISKIILDVIIAEKGYNSYIEYFMRTGELYFIDTDIIDCHYQDVCMEGMKSYHKKNIPWAYVKTLDICSRGKKLSVKSLENTAGTTIIADENVYIMIGNRGEVYDIDRAKFERSYEITDKELDVFEQMLDFMPSVNDVDSGECIAIDEKACLCYPKKGNAIFAKELSRRTKVFGINNGKDYFIGNKGDYLAVRPDDLRDVYIIKRKIFFSTYE